MRAVSLSVCKANIKNQYFQLIFSPLVLVLLCPVSVYAELQTGMEADLVIGQQNFNSAAAVVTRNGVSNLQAVTTDGQSLYVGDYSNNRVLIFNHPTHNYPATAVVLEQSSFTTNAGAAGADRMNGPTYPLRVGQKLIVADYGNNRVLIFNTIPNTNGASADVVLGQPDFITTSAGTTSRKMDRPQTVGSDGQRLFVGEYGNNRVLIYNKNSILRLLLIPTAANYIAQSLIIEGSLFLV